MRLMFKFRSGASSLSEEFGRHRCKNNEWLCRDECESVVHVTVGGGGGGEFSTLDNFNNAGLF